MNMKRRDVFICGAVLCALLTIVFTKSFQKPLYIGLLGSFFAVAAALLLGGALHEGSNEKADLEVKRSTAEQYRLESEERNRGDVLARIDAVSELAVAQYTSLLKLMNEQNANSAEFYKTAADAMGQILSGLDMEKQKLDEVISHIDTLGELTREKCDFLNKTINEQRVESSKYYNYMVGQRWEQIGSIGETLTDVNDKVDTISYDVGSIRSDTEKILSDTVDKIKKDNAALRETIRGVCDTLEAQGKENRESTERLMRTYSDVTAEDIKVLTALAGKSQL